MVVQKEIGNQERFEEWTNYLNTQLINSGFVSEACIIDKMDAQVWGATENFVPHEFYYEQNNQQINEPLTIIQICQSKSIPQIIYMNKEKYRLLRIDSDPSLTIYAKSTSTGRALCLQASEQAVVIAKGTESTPGNLNALVGIFVDYLKEHGF